MRAFVQQRSVSLWSLSGQTQKGFRVTMLSSITTRDPSTQEGEDTEASAPLNPFRDGESPRRHAGLSPSCWFFFLKPIVAIGVGTLLFGSGTTVSMLYFTHVGNVPYLLGPLFLSVGLMFLVTGLVWIPVLKQSLEHSELTKVHHGKGLQVEHRHH